VAVVNQSDAERCLTLDVSNATLPDRGRQWTITGPEIDALNAAGEPQVIHTTESEISDSDGVQAVAPYSSNTYLFELR